MDVLGLIVLFSGLRWMGCIDLGLGRSTKTTFPAYLDV